MENNSNSVSLCIACEDSSLLSKLQISFQQKAPYRVFCTDTLKNISEQVTVLQPDILVMVLPKSTSSFFEEIEQLRAQSYVGMVILLDTHHDHLKTQILELGADLALEKNIDFALLNAAVERLSIRVSQIHALQKLIDQASPKWSLNRTTWVLTSPDKFQTELTATDFKLLMKLLENRCQHVSRYDLASLLGRERCENYEAYINTLISRLRKKANQKTEYELSIKACRGEGYVITTEVELFN